MNAEMNVYKSVVDGRTNYDFFIEHIKLGAGSEVAVNLHLVLCFEATCG